MQKPVPREVVDYGYAQPAPQVDENALALRDLFSTLWAGKWVILLAMLVFFAIGMVMSGGDEVVNYRAEAILLEDPGEDPLQGLGLPGQPAALQTRFTDYTAQLAMLQSRVLAERVFERLDLIENSHYNFTLRPPEESVLQPLNDLIGYQPEAPPPPDDRFVYENALDILRNQITIVHDQYSPVFRISVVAPGAALSADIANALADEFITDQIDANFRRNEAAIVWLTDKVVELKDQLETAERSVSEFDSETNLISEEDFAAVTRQIKGLRERIESVNQQITEVEAQFDTLAIARATNDLVEMAKAADETFLMTLAEQANAGQAEARSTFITEFERVTRQKNLELVRLRSQVGGLQSTLDDLEGSLESQSGELIKMRQLQREAESAGIIYGFYQSRLNEVAVSQGTKQADSRVLSHAVPAFAPAPSGGFMPLLMALIGGFISTIYLVVRDALNKTIRSPDDLEAVAQGINVLGAMPLANFRRRSQLLSFLSKNTTSEYSESVRNVRTSLLMMHEGETPQVIMATSTEPGEGKTTTSISIALHMATLGKRALLVECDIRRRVFYSYFRARPQAGIASAILGEAAYEDVIHSTDHKNLSVIFGDKAEQNAADIFSHRGFDEFLETMRQHYDVIILDVPPVLAVSDARVIAQLADAVLYVVHWNKTAKSSIRRGLQSMQDFGVQVSGVILSKVNTRNSRYSYYTSGNYKYYK